MYADEFSEIFQKHSSIFEHFLGTFAFDEIPNSVDKSSLPQYGNDVFFLICNTEYLK